MCMCMPGMVAGQGAGVVWAANVDRWAEISGDHVVETGVHPALSFIGKVRPRQESHVPKGTG